MPIIRTPDERFRDLPDYPFAPRYLTIAGARMHFLQEDKGEELATRILAFLQANP